MSHEEVLLYINNLKTCASRVSDPVDEIKAIFNKIQVWKEKMGNSQ